MRLFFLAWLWKTQLKYVSPSHCLTNTNVTPAVSVSKLAAFMPCFFLKIKLLCFWGYVMDVKLACWCVKNAIVAFFSGSLAVAADAIHSLSDVVSSVIILIGIKISERQARGFPYGLYKVENLVAMVTSVLILFAGYEITKTIFTGPSRPLPSRIPLAMAGIGTTILVTWLFSSYELKKGRETG